MEYYSNFIWEKNGREINEDSLCLKQIVKEGTTYLLAVVCDGIGGLAEGENASTFVADCMDKEFVRLLERKRKPGNRQMKNALLRQIYKCHKILKTYSGQKDIRLGTTVSMLLICGRYGYSFHVGDSGIFKGKNGLKRITGIHHARNGALRQAVGIGDTPKVEQKKFRVRKNSAILLCSDGFYKKAEKEICSSRELTESKKRKREYSEENKIGEWLSEIYGKAGMKGERDNVSAVCVICR